MNIIYFLLLKFFNEEKTNIIMMIINSFVINILQTNGISFITANIITSLQNKNKINTYHFFQWFILISIVFILLYHSYKYFQNKLLTKLRQWMRHHLVEILLKINNEKFSEMNFTKLNSPINRISSVSFMVFNDIITYLLPNVTFLLIVAVYFLYKNMIFGIGFIFGNMVLGVYMWWHLQYITKHNEDYEKQVTESESYLIDILNNMDKIVYRGQVNSEIEIFSDKTNKSIDMAFEFYSNTSYYGTIMTSIVFVILFGCIAYLIYLFFHGKIELTIFITFFTILLLYRDKMITIIQQIPDFVEFVGRSESVLKHFKNMDYLGDLAYSELDENKNTSNDLLTFDTIECVNITFYYNNKIPILNNFNIMLKTENKIIGITGLSGNGKSTFAKLLLKMYQPNSGDIYIDGINIRDIDANYIRKNITYVNQTSKLFDKKIMDNIFYGCNDITICSKHLEEIMKYPKIRELYKNVDFKNKLAGSLGENLSGGQRQIINIIGGLVNPSKILILDEPTNALDMNLKQELLGLIRDFKNHKKCIMIITHDKDAFGLFDEKIEI
jgi:ABC-type bacteriocin/lantibiotic exporter with double-glycine peptidase domain